MAGKKKGGKARPKTAVKRGKKDNLLDVDRPITAASPEDQAAFARLKTEIYGIEKLGKRMFFVKEDFFEK